MRYCALISPLGVTRGQVDPRPSLLGSLKPQVSAGPSSATWGPGYGPLCLVALNSWANWSLLPTPGLTLAFPRG